MKEFLKNIDRSLSKALLSHPLGFYPEILGFKGRLKSRLKNNKKINILLDTGELPVGNVLNSEDCNLLSEFFSSCPPFKHVVNRNDSFSYRLNLDKYEFAHNNPLQYNKINEKLETLFDTKIILDEINMFRNFYCDDDRVISSDWHFDRRSKDLYRFFIYLSDVKNTDFGPFHYLNFKTSKKLGKTFHRESSAINEVNVKNEINIFLGNKGTGAIIDTQKLLHRAGRVKKGNYRDMIELVFKLN
ncbi:hypothetical protein N8978_00405 [Flavobacteriaceae bacterium]|nr:hypothetical protein [Flavobacteriaceae bacterium]